MEKEVIVLFLLGILLVSPLVLAQEQAQIYSGFDRFIGNARMFFSFGDKKVILALEIREKELNSAIVNIKNGDDEGTETNLEHAWKKLQFVQEKISLNVAEEIKISSKKIKDRINDEEGLSDNFELYILEEEKTGLKAEWIIEIQGKEGQTLTNEIVGGDEGRVIVEGESEGQTKVREIETRMNEINNEIKNWVVDNFVEEDKDDGLTWEVANKIIEEDKDDGLTREIKTYVVGDGTGRNDVVDDGSGGGMAFGTTADSGANTGPVTNQIDGGTSTNQIDSGTVLDDTDASDDPVVSSSGDDNTVVSNVDED